MFVYVIVRPLCYIRLCVAARDQLALVARVACLVGVFGIECVVVVFLRR